MLMVFLFTSTLGFAQLGKPEVENVYGGRINYIAGYPYKSDTSRIIISTESANSLFYADVKSPATGASSFTAFRKLASADNTKNYGAGIRYFQVHQSSGAIYFSYLDKLKAAAAPYAWPPVPCLASISVVLGSFNVTVDVGV